MMVLGHSEGDDLLPFYPRGGVSLKSLYMVYGSFADRRIWDIKVELFNVFTYIPV